MVQPVTNKDKQHVQQLVTALVLTTIHVTISLLTHIPKGSDHQPSNGRQLRDSPRGSSPRGNPLKGNPPRKPPFNPHVGSYGWSTPHPHMFIPPWYQPLVVQLVLEPTTKLPYRKLQYPTYVKYIDPSVHIKVFKKAVKVNGETMEADIINLFGFTFKDNIFEWGKKYSRPSKLHF